MNKKIITSKDIANLCGTWPIAVDENIFPSISTYVNLLMRWNKVMNLVGARHWQECMDNLIIDSFYLAEFIKTLPLNIDHDFKTLDLGAGAGLPGIVLRMLWQEGSYDLIEVREKRALFLSNVLAQVPLINTSVFRGRVEDYFTQTSSSADMIVSRAFMPWEQILNLVIPSSASISTSNNALKHGGRVLFLTLKPMPTKELSNLGWHGEAEYAYNVQGAKRYFWSVYCE